MNQTNNEIDESLFFLEQLARDHHNDGAPETALDIYRAAAMIRALPVLREQNARLRNVVSSCADALDNGSAISVQCSIDFMEQLPSEVRAVVSTLRDQREADTKVLNWLDAQRSDLVDYHYGEPMLIGHSWGVDGQYHTVRQAITAAMSAKEG